MTIKTNLIILSFIAIISAIAAQRAGVPFFIFPGQITNNIIAQVEQTESEILSASANYMASAGGCAAGTVLTATQLSPFYGSIPYDPRNTSGTGASSFGDFKVVCVTNTSTQGTDIIVEDLYEPAGASSYFPPSALQGLPNGSTASWTSTTDGPPSASNTCQTNCTTIAASTTYGVVGLSSAF